MGFESVLGAVGSLLGPVGAVAGMIIPPAFDFIKKKFLPAGTDTPEATLSTLATTNPEVMVKYVDAQTKQMEAQIKYFNRDVVGEPHQWVVSLRAAIRPVVTAMCCGVAIADSTYSFVMGTPPTGAAIPAWTLVGSWFGSRLK
jgi:hypothetical protein